ncbi:TPA: Tn3 family transposase [Enterococcus faecalis]|nr:Tn3 family transposase [Enterococcus faecalis]
MKKYKRHRELLNSVQREDYLNSLLNLSDYELSVYYTMSQLDKKIICERRTDHAKIGYAVQLCLLRYPGFVPSNVLDIPLYIIEFIGKQIDILPSEFLHFLERPTSLREHRREIKERFQFTSFSKKLDTELLNHLEQAAEDNHSTFSMLTQLINFLRAKKVIISALSHLETIIWQAKADSDQRAQHKLLNLVSDEQIQGINTLLDLRNQSNLSNLGWLKLATKQASANTFKLIDEKLMYLNQFSYLPEELPISSLKQKEYYRLANIYEANSLREINTKKRVAVLICFICQKRKQLIDHAVQTHASIMASSIKYSKKKMDEHSKKKKKSLTTTVKRYVEIGELLIQAKEEQQDPIALIQKQLDWNVFVADIAAAKVLQESVTLDHYDFLSNRYSHLRTYSPALIKHFTFYSVDSAQSVIKGIHEIQKVIETKQRYLPLSSPTDFLSERWKKYVFCSDGKISRKHYELALLDTLNNQIKAGNIAVEGSNRYQSFDSYLISKQEWLSIGQKQNHLAVPLDFESYIAERKQTLMDNLRHLSEELPRSELAFIDGNRIKIRPLSTIVPAEAEIFSQFIGSNLPMIRITDLLVQVNQWCPFFQEFVHASTGETFPFEDLKILCIAILALGTNMGLKEMADHTPEVTYDQLARVTRWYLQDENIEKATALLVNFQHKLPIAAYWGDGTTSSSDGIRKKVPVSSLHASYDGKFGYEKDITIYRHLADQYQAYSTKIINSSDRDATHIFDGIINHNTDLAITEHYADTHGYTNQVFGFAHLMGINFAPRIKNISSMRLYHFGEIPENLVGIVTNKINSSIIEDNYQDILRVAHSIRERKVDGSLILSKLGSYARKNSLALAANEMGKIEKTIFLANYYIDELARRRIQKGLNKGELVNALTRKVNIGKNDELHDPSYEGQSQIAKLTDFIINAIVVWNSLYIQEIVQRLRDKNDCPEELLQHISPIRWTHIKFYGDYMFSDDQVEDIHSFNFSNL